MSNKIFNLYRGTHIISADNRIWEIACHDYPCTKTDKRLLNCLCGYFK
nr:MAG TPA: hypothetical protein [Caudoviricetes sp.]